MSSEAFGNLLVVLAIGFALVLFLVFIASLVWVHRDAERRGKTGCLWALIVFFTWPIGLIAYFLLRDRTVQL